MKKELFERAIMGVDLPGEVVPGQPIIEIVGGSRVIIEHHRGVVGYGCTEICVKVKNGLYKIIGSDLILLRMTKQQLVISGTIECVCLCRG